MELRKLRQFDPKSYEAMVEKLRQMGNSFFDQIVQTFKNSTKRYISDVIAINSTTEADPCYPTLSSYGSSYSGNLFIIVLKHDDVHVVHDCSHSKRSCRCSWSNYEIVRQHVRKSRVTPNPSSQTCQNPSGSMFSYMSSFEVEEPYSDYRIQMKVYDGRRASSEQPL